MGERNHERRFVHTNPPPTTSAPVGERLDTSASRRVRAEMRTQPTREERERKRGRVAKLIAWLIGRFT